MNKRLFVIALIICIQVCFFPSFVLALDHETVLPADMDQALITDTIVTWINTLHSDILPKEITPGDIDLRSAYKIYVGTNIFTIKSNNYDEIVECLESGIYIFEVPVRVGEMTFVANIQIINPLDDLAYQVLTEEQIASHEKRVGKWDVSVLSLYDAEAPFVDYDETAANITGIKDIQPVLVGGLPGLTMAVAIYPDADGDIGKMAILQPNAVAWDALGLTASAYAGKAIDYEEIKERALLIPSPNPNLTGGVIGGARDTEKSGWTVPVVCIASIAVFLAGASIFLIAKRTAVSRLR